MVQKAVAIVCYVLAQVGGTALAVLVLSLGLGWEWQPLHLPQPWPWVVDGGWLVLFGLQHSLMARASFKRQWTRLVPNSLERSVFVAVSGGILLGMALTWQHLDGPMWWELPRPSIVVPLVAVLGMGLINNRFDHAGLFGLRQAWAGDQPQAPETLLLVGPYRFIRHPLMTCLLVFLWAQPVMTPTLAALSGDLTLYVLLGVLLEERDLLRRFAPDYAAYRRRVPAFLPWRRPLAPGEKL